MQIIAPSNSCPISPYGTKPTFAKRRIYVCYAAKPRARSRAALGQYPPIGDRPGQCLVSYRFETRIGKADKAKPIQTKKCAIHTLGQRTKSLRDRLRALP